MVLLTPQENVLFFRGRKRFGYTKADRLGLRTYSEALATNPYAGIYQAKVTRKGKKISRMKFYKPTQVYTVPQQANRTKFANAILAWQSLSPTAKKEYDKEAYRKKISGYNLFIRLYMHDLI